VRNWAAVVHWSLFQSCCQRWNLDALPVNTLWTLACGLLRYLSSATLMSATSTHDHVLAVIKDRVIKSLCNKVAVELRTVNFASVIWKFGTPLTQSAPTTKISAMSIFEYRLG